MDIVASALGRGRIAIEEMDPRGDDARYCLGEYYAELARRFESGFDVSLSRNPEADDMIRPRGAFLVAMSDGLPIGCVGREPEARSRKSKGCGWRRPHAG